MNFTMKFITAISIIALSLPLAAQGWGEGRPHHRGHGPRGPHRMFGDIEYMKDVLGLSDKQIKKIAAINKETGDKLRALHKKLRTYREELGIELRKKEVNLARVKKILYEIAPIEAETRYLRITHRIRIERVLTDKQRRELFRERRGMRMKRRFRD